MLVSAGVMSCGFILMNCSVAGHKLKLVAESSLFVMVKPI